MKKISLMNWDEINDAWVVFKYLRKVDRRFNDQYEDWLTMIEREKIIDRLLRIIQDKEFLIDDLQTKLTQNFYQRK